MNDFKNHSLTYALCGALCGLGAPLGALALHLTIGPSGPFVSRLLVEWSRESYFYLYMLVTTVGIFALFGFVLGRKSDQLERDKAQATALALTDGLTGLYNHRYLQEHLAAEFSRSRRYGHSLTCLMLDIDNFKSINDSFGHPFGDEVLRVIARVIREQIRRVDTAGRYGGEEFLVLMPSTTSEAARPVAERIRAEIQDFPFYQKGELLQVTVSIGMATIDGTQDTVGKDALLSCADQALYRAKRGGKNRTESAAA